MRHDYTHALHLFFNTIVVSAVYELGMTGIPIYNVNNNCSTGSTALYMAYQFVRGGVSDCVRKKHPPAPNNSYCLFSLKVLALGFEKMQRGSLRSTFDDRTNPMDKHMMFENKKKKQYISPLELFV